MTPDDKELWKRVTESTAPLGKPAAAIRSPARLGRVGMPGLPGTRGSHSFFHPCLDLHGFTVQQAHAEVRRHVSEGFARGLKHVTVITGLSGQIRREFQFWAEQMPQVRKAEPLNGGGAFKLQFVKRRPK